MAKTRDQFTGAPVKGRKVTLGQTESNALNLAFTCHGAETMFFVATIQGPRIEEKQLVKSLKLLQRRYRFLSCTVRRAKTGKIYVQEDPDVVIAVETRVLEDEKTTQKRIFDEELDKHNIRETAIVYLIQKPAESDDGVQQIGLFLQHWFSDGTSMINVFHRLLEGALSAESTSVDETSVEYRPFDLDSDTTIQRTFAKQYSRLSFWSSFVRNGAGTVAMFYSPFAPSWYRLPFKEPQILKLPRSKVFESTKNFSYMLQLTEQETGSLLQKCRSNESTITCIVLAAVEEAILSERKDPKKESGRVIGSVSVSVRGVCGVADDALSHYVGGAFSNRDPKWSSKGKLDANGLWDRSREARKEISLTDKEKLVAAVVAGMGLSSMPNTTFLPSFGLSSWSAKGPVQKQYSDYQVLDGELTQNCRPIYYPLFSIYTICGRLHLSLMALVPLFDPDQLKRVLDYVIRLLREAGAIENKSGDNIEENTNLLVPTTVAE